MRLLVLGGTVFCSYAVAAEALARGHEVVCAARGVGGTVAGGAGRGVWGRRDPGPRVPDGADLVVWDRSDPVPRELAGPTGATGDRFDAVVDVARLPSQVRAAVAALPDAHWVFVSTVSVYADDATPGGRPGRLPLHTPVDQDRPEDPDAYGPMKVACEEAVLAGASSATVVRPGLIVGPGDRSGRFGYWPRRLAEAGASGTGAAEVLAPGQPDDTVQVIDVRDLAAWIVTCAERRTTGTYDGVGPVRPLGELLEQVARGVGSEVSLTWVPQEVLEAHGVQPWAGPDSVPLWLPRPAYDGMLSHDPGPSGEAGLVVRPVADTARDTLAWLRATPGAPVTGIDRAREAELLAAWRQVSRGSGSGR